MWSSPMRSLRKAIRGRALKLKSTVEDMMATERQWQNILAGKGHNE